MIKRLHSSRRDHFILPAMLCIDGMSSENGTHYFLVPSALLIRIFHFKVLYLSLSRLSPSDFRGLVFGFLAFLVF